MANKLRLEEEQQQAEGTSQQLSESAQAMKDSSALQQLASQINRETQQVQLLWFSFHLIMCWGALLYHDGRSVTMV